MNVLDPSHSKSAAFRSEQRVVVFAIALAALITLLVLGIATAVARSDVPVPFDARLQHALRLDLFVVAWLLATIANVARLRFFSERDIGGGGSGGVEQGA